MEEDVCEEYKSSLLDLTCNSKPLINMLTMLAEENIDQAPRIVRSIEEHLQKVLFVGYVLLRLSLRRNVCFEELASPPPIVVRVQI
ncbi:conserved hypothetical protein [Ixodes scapularis]|uniref:CID domain-containing protein n=1 Tax=Ixodes scapularis TaxID=6945 RepID=B7Q0P7_IXOSC|nr:conserved hypothetical protein [Ixodes scapularis]|eukprot:XP_002408088.1 conserved hypothetical protein [Ixodes scapularis]